MKYGTIETYHKLYIITWIYLHYISSLDHTCTTFRHLTIFALHFVTWPYLHYISSLDDICTIFHHLTIFARHFVTWFTIRTYDFSCSNGYSWATTPYRYILGMGFIAKYSLLLFFCRKGVDEKILSLLSCFGEQTFLTYSLVRQIAPSFIFC